MNRAVVRRVSRPLARCLPVLCLTLLSASSDAAAEGRACTPEPMATAMAYGDLVNCRIDFALDSDLFRFEGTSGEMVNVQVVSRTPAFTPCLEVKDPAGAPAGFVLCTGRNTFRLTSTGPYTIVVREGALSMDTGDYALDLQRLAPPSPGARELSYGVPADDEINSTGDVDLFFFRGTAGASVRVEVTSLTTGFRPCLEVKDPSGDPAGFVLCTGRNDFTLTATGVHAVLVKEGALSTDTGSYRLTVECLAGPCDVPSPVPVPIAGVWFIEETGPGAPGPHYASIHESGDTVVVILLDLDGAWTFAVGTRSGATVQGTLHLADGTPAGTFSVTVTGSATLTGQNTRAGTTTSLAGTKVF